MTKVKIIFFFLESRCRGGSSSSSSSSSSEEIKSKRSGEINFIINKKNNVFRLNHDVVNI